MPPPTIRPFDAAAATPTEWAAVTALRNTCLAERDPDALPATAEWTRSAHQTAPGEAAVDRWAVWDAGGACLAFGQAAAWAGSESAPICDYDLAVHPAARRRGLARALLARLAPFIEAQGRPYLLTPAYSTVPAGAAFQRRLGATCVHTELRNCLRLADVDPALLARWSAPIPGFALTHWDGPYPDAALPEILAMLRAAADIPQGGVALGPIAPTAAEIRDGEAAMAARQEVRWTLAARETATGAIAGYTEIHYSALRPEILRQEGTVVLPAYRGRGLGRWLKAAMLAHLAAAAPAARRIETRNAPGNAAMLHLNSALGFRPTLTFEFWQLPRPALHAYLAS